MAQRAGVSFELERVDLEGDQLVVSGHWSGVRGLRFVRPALVDEDRRILATLEHKPWTPALDRTWTAAFPWERDDVDIDGLTLAVSPQIAVSLGDGARAEPEPRPAPRPAAPSPLRAAEPDGSALQPQPEPEPEPEVEAAAEPEPAPEPDPEAQLGPQPEAEPEPESQPAAGLREQSLKDDRLALLEEEIQAVMRERSAAYRDRDRAFAQLEEAVAAREAAIRTRTRMELEHADALQATERAEAALAAAHAQRDEANAQRDEVLLAYRGLQRHVQAERAQEERAQAGGDDADADSDAPIGVRRMPAARTVMAELQRPAGQASKLPISVFDLWVIRVLGTVAAACFILLLLAILRVFI